MLLFLKMGFISESFFLHSLFSCIFLLRGEKLQKWFAYLWIYIHFISFEREGTSFGAREDEVMLIAIPPVGIVLPSPNSRFLLSKIKLIFTFWG